MDNARWAARAAEVFLAAAVVVILIRLHTAIVEYALTMVGGRTDIPLIVAIKAECGDKAETYLVPAVWRAVADKSGRIPTDPGPIRACGSATQVLATAPANRQFVAFLNDQSFGPITTRSPLVVSGAAPLRRGINAFSVFDAGASLPFPLPSLRSPFLSDEVGMMRGLRSTPWGYEVPFVEAPAFARVVVGPEERPANGGTETVHRSGPYRAPQGPAWMLAQGSPGEAFTTSIDERSQRTQTIDPDGFAIVETGGPTGAQPSADLKAADEPVWGRQLILSRPNPNSLQAALTACLPPDHALVDWSRTNAIAAPELIQRLTGFAVANQRRADHPDWFSVPRVTISEPSAEQACVTLRAQYSVTNGIVVEGRSDTFLVLPHDELVLDGLAKDVSPFGRPADMTEGDRLTWRGTGDPRAQRVQLQPTSFALQSAFGRALSAMRPQIAPSAERPPPNLLERWRNLANSFPDFLRTLLWSFVVAVPAALIYWALGKYPAQDARSTAIERARAGILGLLAFMVAQAMHPILLEFSRTVFDVTYLRVVMTSEIEADQAFANTLAPIAFVVILMVPSLLRPDQKRLAKGRRPLARLIAALLSLLLIVAAAGVSAAERVLVAEPAAAVAALDRTMDAGEQLIEMGIPIALALLLLIWSLFVLLTFWIPVYWLARSALDHRRLYAGAFVAAALAVFVPLVTPLAEALRILFGWITVAPASFGPFRYEPFSLAAAALWAISYVSLLASVVLIVTLVLRGFREIMLTMLPPVAVPVFRDWSHTGILVIIAILIVGPATGALGSAEAVNLRVFQLIATFQTYGALLAFAAPVTILGVLARSDGDATSRFHFDENAMRLLAGTFAGYIALWARDPMVVIVLAVVAWFVFQRGIIGPEPASNGESEQNLAQRLLAYRETERLQQGRRATIEKSFTSGKIDAAELKAKSDEIAAQLKQAKDALKMSVTDAKRRLFACGPQADPLANGYLGAIVGLAVAGLFQVVLRFNLDIGAEHAPSWLALLQAFLVDPNYKPVGSEMDASGLLELVGYLLNAVAFWVLIGFLFGFVFHRVVGTDGFVKAIVFGTGIAIPFLISQALAAPNAGASLESVAGIVPIFIFLLFLGSLVFDRSCVQKLGLGPAQLLEIYGLRTSIGYASLAGILAGVKPLMDAFSWLFGKHT